MLSFDVLVRLEAFFVGLNANRDRPVNDLVRQVDEHVVWTQAVKVGAKLCVIEMLVDVALRHDEHLSIEILQPLFLQELHVVIYLLSDECFETLLNRENWQSLTRLFLLKVVRVFIVGGQQAV